MQLQILRDQLNALENEMDRIAQQGLDTSFQGATIREVKAHIADLESQQNLQERVEQAKETGYLLDTLYTSNGMSMAELSFSPANHELVAIEVQKAFLAQQDAFNVKLNDLQYRNDSQAKIIESGTADNQRLIWENGNLRDTLNQAIIDKADAESKRDNAMTQVEELQERAKQQGAKISELLEQQAGSAVPVAPLSEEEKESKLMAEVMGKQIKVIDVRPKSDSFDNQIFIATNVITGVEFEDHYIYLCKKSEDKPRRYKEISQEAAEQLRAEYANKKAEIEALTAVIPTQEHESIEYVTELEAPAQEPTFHEDQVDAATVGLATESPSDEGQVVAEESEVITLESLHERVKALEARAA